VPGPERTFTELVATAAKAVPAVRAAITVPMPTALARFGSLMFFLLAGLPEQAEFPGDEFVS
jgi:hypothetical protein